MLTHLARSTAHRRVHRNGSGRGHRCGCGRHCACGRAHPCGCGRANPRCCLRRHAVPLGKARRQTRGSCPRLEPRRPRSILYVVCRMPTIHSQANSRTLAHLCCPRPRRRRYLTCACTRTCTSTDMRAPAILHMHMYSHMPTCTCTHAHTPAYALVPTHAACTHPRPHAHAHVHSTDTSTHINRDNNSPDAFSVLAMTYNVVVVSIHCKILSDTRVSPTRENRRACRH